MIEKDGELHIESYKVDGYWRALRPSVLMHLSIFQQALPTAERLGLAEGVLYRAYIDRLHAWIAAADKGYDEVKKIPQVFNEMAELYSWIRKSPDRDFAGENDALAEIFDQCQFGYKATDALIGDLPKKMGAPPKHEADLTAYNLKRFKKSNREIALELYGPVNPNDSYNDDEHREDKLEKALGRVRAIVEKYRPK